MKRFLFALLTCFALPVFAGTVEYADDGTVWKPATGLKTTSQTLTTPVLSGTVTGTYTLGGTPSVAVGGVTGLGTGVATFLATPSSTNLATAVTGETGSGAAVFGTAPTLGAAIVTPAVTTISGDGAITIASGVVLLIKGSAAAITLAAPASQDGTRITVIANSDFAHVITFPSAILLDGTTGANVTATFAAFKGASITVVASGVTWLVESLNVVTCAP